MATDEVPDAMDDSDIPKGLSARGAALYSAVSESNTIDPGGQILLEEACRTVDRLEQLHWILRGSDNRWLTLAEEATDLGNGTVRVEIIMDHALVEVRQQMLALRQIFNTLGMGEVSPAQSGQDDLWTRLEKAMHPEKQVSAVG